MKLIKTSRQIFLLFAFFLASLSTTAVIAEESAIETVIIETTLGDITLELDAARAPESVKNFMAYALSGFYNGTIFHRVIKDFMIQGGGFSTEYAKKTTHKPIKNEANNGLTNNRYTIVMARTIDPHSAAAQFFINTKDNGFLNHTRESTHGWGYAVFGQVVKGFNIVDRINQVTTGAGGPFRQDVPQQPVIIKTIRIIEKSPKAPLTIPKFNTSNTNP